MDYDKYYKKMKPLLTPRSFDLLKRFHALKTSRTTKRGQRYLEKPTAKDIRWGESNLGGIWPITLNRVDKLIIQMEKCQQLGLYGTE